MKPLDFEPGQLTSDAPSRLRRVSVGLVLTLLPLVLLAAGLAGFLALRASRPMVATAPVAAPVRLVEAMTVSPGENRPMLTLYGQVTPGRQVDLRALVAGEVKNVSPALVDGGLVRAGDVLLGIDPFDYEAAVTRARADIAETRARLAEFDARIQLEREALVRAEEQVAITERERDRIAGLAAKDIATARALEEVTVRLIQARSQVEQRRNQMAIAQAQRGVTEASLPRLDIALRSAERALANTRLIAPFDAVVSNAGAEVGRLLNATDRVATLTARDRLEVRFTLTDAQYGRLGTDAPALIGKTVDIIWRGGAVEIKAPAAIARVAPVASAAAGGFDVFARIDGRADAMRAGAFVEVRMPDQAYPDTIRVPQAAMQDGEAVFLIVEGALRRVAVTPIAFEGDHMLVRGAIPPGSVVMISRLGQAADGVKVEIRK